MGLRANPACALQFNMQKSFTELWRISLCADCHPECITPYPLTAEIE